MTPKILAAALLTAGTSFACPAEAATIDRAAWNSDYARLKVALAQNYANMDWQVERRGINLQRADKFIAAALDAANDDTAATLTMVKLVAAFHDPHLELRAGAPPESATLVPRSSSADGPAPLPVGCGKSSYVDGPATTKLPYPASPRWASVSEGPFQAGLLDDIGIIRIPAFGEDRYKSACDAVARPGLQGRELQLATRAELNRRLTKLITVLRARGMKRLVIDLSGNGGGSEWSSEAITLFTPGKLHRQLPRLAAPACDRSGIWRGEKAPCSIYSTPAETETVVAKRAAAWTGPLAIIGDRRTASAAEEFITWARDNGRAVYGGERTAGAGCGYVDGGAAFQFSAVPMYLMLPNCSRYTRDGVNEIEGQKPDLAIDWSTTAPEAIPTALNALFALGAKQPLVR
jgi:hypothetical protein